MCLLTFEAFSIGRTEGGGKFVSAKKKPCRILLVLNYKAESESWSSLVNIELPKVFQKGFKINLPKVESL